MKRALTNRADLLRALAYNDSTLTTAIAELLGYEDEDSQVVPRGQQSPLPKSEEKTQRNDQDSTDITTVYQPDPVPFWRLETFEPVASVKLSSAPVPVKRPKGKQHERPTTLPGFTPLASKQAVLTELRKVPATRRTTSEIDVEAVIERVSQGRLLTQLPYRQRRAWGSSILIIKDRSRRLTPYWEDQDHVVNIVNTLYPPSGMTIARIGDGDRQPVIHWPAEQYGQAVSPSPGTIVLVLGDLGCLAHEGESLHTFWRQWGRELREHHIPAVALVPARITDISSELARTWTIVHWGAASTGTVESAAHRQENPFEQLLTLLSPAVRIEPGLLRAVRGLLPEGRNDPGLEAKIWQDAAIVSQHSVAASWHARVRETYLERFAAQSETLRSEVLHLIQSWRINLPPMVTIEEQSWLDEDSRGLVDWQSAVTALVAYVDELHQARQLSPLTVAWIFRFLERSPTDAFHDPRMEQVRHDLFELVRSYEAVTQVYGWVDPKKLPTRDQIERKVALWQTADQLLVKTIDSANEASIVRGSPLGIVHTASGEVKVAIGEPPPEKNAFWQSKRPPRWAQDWGWDEFGAWVTFRVSEVEQRLRWIPAGSFLMGSPKNEAGRDGDEGPQHEVQLTRGFWLFDTPCTQALWQAVMESNPSEFKGENRPVETVSWEDCQKFIAKLNERLPELGLQLPTEAEWEYACRAGTTTARYEEDLDAIAWYDENSNGETHPVKQKRPNGWGLYDMLGNVDEWCHDGLRKYTTKRQVDPLGPTTAGANRAIRGGYWYWDARDVRSASRDALPPGSRLDILGFRCSSSNEYQLGQARPAGRVAQRKAEPAESASRWPTARLVNLNVQSSITIDIPRDGGFYISTDRDRLHFTQITLPSWATEIGRDVYGLWIEFEVKKIRQRLRWIVPGRFLMGSPREEGRYEDEVPQHEVQLTHGFWLFDTLCTQALWQAVMGKNPSRFKGGARPVEQVNWQDTQKFIAALNSQLPGLNLGLPTEAEWEYACRAGTDTPRYAEDLDAIAWYEKNSNNETHEVKLKKPNAWGLYDMLGNVLEWCHDGLRDYKAEVMTDPLGPTDAGANRAVRGGYWFWSARSVRSACRDAGHPGDRSGYLGFRCSSSGQASRMREK